jgi:ATP-dependent Lon protease
MTTMTTDSQKEAGVENPFLTAESSQSVAVPEIPTQLPILPMRDVALFPGISGPLAVGREASVRLIGDAS